MLEVSITDANNDRTKWHAGEGHKQFLCLFHIVTVTVRDYDDYVINPVGVEA